MMANEEVILTHEAGYASANYKSLEGTKNVTKRMGCLMAHVGDKGAEEPKLEDVPVIKEYPEAIPENLLELSTQ